LDVAQASNVGYGICYRSQTYLLSATPQTTIAELIAEIQIISELFASRQQTSSGYPPQQILTDSTAVADPGIKEGPQLSTAL
jgi:hypothetical protein